NRRPWRRNRRSHLTALAVGVSCAISARRTKDSRCTSPDGGRIVFNSNRSGVFDLYLKSATDTTPEELLLATPQNKAPNDWSLEGQFLLYRSPSLTTGFDLWALPMEGDRKPFPVLQKT